MNLWEPIFAVVSAIFLTVLLFLLVYGAAYLIVKSGFFTYNKIKQIVKDNKQE